MNQNTNTLLDVNVSIPTIDLCVRIVPIQSNDQLQIITHCLKTHFSTLPTSSLYLNNELVDETSLVGSLSSTTGLNFCYR